HTTHSTDLHSFPTRRSSDLWPLITTDPPVLGKTQWSAWNVACQIYQGNLPNRKLSDTCERCDRQWVLALFYVPKLPTALYVLIVDRKSTRLNSSHRTISYAV